MTITVEDGASLALANAAMKALEEITARVAAMGGKVYTVTVGDGPDRPSIHVYANQVYMTLDIRFDATSLSGCTTQSGGQSGDTP
jgi:hypothetical protein